MLLKWWHDGADRRSRTRVWEKEKGELIRYQAP